MIDYTIIGDPHIDERYLTEADFTFEEIINIGTSKVCIVLGDVFHKNKPSPLEVQFTLKWFKRLVAHYKEVVVILGNHDLYGGIQTTKILRYIGVTVIDKPELVRVTPYGKLFFGHYFAAESVDNYSDETRSIKELEKNHKYVFLGHQHRFQEFSPIAYHLGSTRYVGFGEYDKPLIPKKIALIDDKGALKFKDLKTPYPLVQFNQVEGLLKHYNHKAKGSVISDKVRIVYEDFNTYKNDINQLAKLPYLFEQEVKLKLDFKNKHIIKNFNTDIQAKQLSTVEVVNKWLAGIKDEDVKELLEKESRILCD